jgi:hypothetical protein
LKDHDDEKHEQIEEFDLDGERVEVCLDCLIQLIKKNWPNVFAWQLREYHESWHRGQEAETLWVDDIDSEEVLVCPGCVGKVFKAAKKRGLIDENEDKDDEF